MGLLNEQLFILVAQGAAKLPELKVGYTKKDQGLEHGPHLSEADRAQQQNFFQTSNFVIWQFCSLLSYKGA